MKGLAGPVAVVEVGWAPLAAGEALAPVPLPSRLAFQSSWPFVGRWAATATFALRPVKLGNSGRITTEAVDRAELANCEYAAAVRRRVRYFIRHDL